MKKLIKLEFNNTTRERKTEDSYSELYSYDKNNGSFEFEILNETLTTEQVTALFKFTESNKIWKTTGTVEGNKVNVTFDTSLITQNETVICYLYFDEEQRTSDTFRFKFKVKVSEIDKMSRYEVKERFINNTVIVDRLDVVTKDELKEVLKNVGGIATEGLLTEVKAEELYAKKTEAVDNTNFELVKNRVLALELKTDKDTVYDDSEVKERLTTLENKPPVDLSNYATKEELRNVSGSQPNVDNLVTKEELENKHYISDVSNLATKEELQEVRNSQPTVDTSNLVTKQELEDKHFLTDQALNNYALKSELYNDSDLKARVEVLEQKTDNDTIYDDTEVKRRLTEIESKPAVDTSFFITEEELNNKAYLTEHQDLTPYALKSEIPQPYNDSPLNERVTALENRPAIGGSVDTSKFVTGELLESELEQLASSATKPLYIPYHHDTAKNYLDNTTIPSEKTFPDKRAGKILANVDKQNLENIQIFKGDENNSQFVDFDAAMYSLANSLPTDYSLESVRQDIKNKVTFLSNKNFSEVVPKEELKAIIREAGVNVGESVDTSSFATKEELAKAVTKEELVSKNYLTQHQPLDNLVTKEELNNKGYVTDEVLNSKGYLTEETLNSKNYLTEDVLNTKNYLTQHQDLSSLVTKQELENKHYLTEHQPLTHLATTSDLEVLRNIAVSKSELSSKVDNTEFNTFKDNVVTKTELSEKGYLTTHQDLSEYALKSELYNDTDLKNRVETLENRPNNDTAYDDTDLKRRVSELEQRPDNNIVYDDRDLRERVEALENRPDNNTVYDDTALSNRVKALEDVPKLDITKFATKDDVVAFNGELNNKVSSVDFEAFKTTIPAPYNDKALSDRVLALENKPASGGTQTQDTGWITISDDNPLHGNVVKIRRINDMVHVSLSNPNSEGLQLQVDDTVFHVILANKEIGKGFTPLNKLAIPVTEIENVMQTTTGGTDVIGQVIFKVENGKVMMNGFGDKFSISEPKEVLVNDFSYFTEDPFPTNLH